LILYESGRTDFYIFPEMLNLLHRLLRGTAVLVPDSRSDAAVTFQRTTNGLHYLTLLTQPAFRTTTELTTSFATSIANLIGLGKVENGVEVVVRSVSLLPCFNKSLAPFIRFPLNMYKADEAGAHRYSSPST
jgi:hypothetical protein